MDFRRLFRRREPSQQDASQPNMPLERPVPERVQEPGRMLVKWQTGECEALAPGDLSDVAVIAQALDNQWVSRSLLERMLRRPSRDGLRGVETPRRPIVRAEYVRGLINADQLVVNRAFMYNSSAVSQDYKPAPDGSRPAGREAFKTMLDRGIIVPYLFREQTPVDLPINLQAQARGDFSIDRLAFAEWARICQEVRTRCVRLSWDDMQNITFTNGISGTFNTRTRTLDGPIEWGNTARYLSDLAVPEPRKDDFLRRLRHVEAWSVEQGRVTRDDLYRQFVVADGTETWEGKYDPSKPYSGVLKQLFDLNYSVNLTDALGLNTLTPIDSLSRISLQELAVRIHHGQEQGIQLTVENLKTLLRQFAFGLVQGGAYLQSMGSLALDDVLAVRGTDEWAAYIETVRQLLRDPADSLQTGAFQQRMEAVYRRYAVLASAMTQYVVRRRAPVALEKWTPVATLVIDIGGALLLAAIVPPSAGFSAAFVYSLVGSVLQEKVGVVARLLIKGAVGRGAKGDLEASLDFMRGQLQRARGAEQEIRGLLQEIGFRHVPDLQQQLTRQYEENVNFPEEVDLALAV